MSEPMELTIRTDYSNRKVAGEDTIIMSYPRQFMRDGMILMRELSNGLRRISEAQAKNLGELLHSAHFWVTDDPFVVEAHGVSPSHPDCKDCQQGLRTALEMMAKHPGDYIVGELFWAEQDEPRRLPSEPKHVLYRKGGV